LTDRFHSPTRGERGWPVQAMLISARPQTDTFIQEDSQTAFRSIACSPRFSLRTAGAVSFLAACVISGSVLVAGMASADPKSTVSGDGQVRDGNYVQAPENVSPSGQTGCRFWQKSHAGRNDQAQQNFHQGFNNLVVGCGG
jgi:hypothetical protein